MNKRPHHDLDVGHLDRCQICGNDALELIIGLGHHAPCDSLLWPHSLNEAENTYPLNFLRCPECSLAQIDYVVPPEKLFFPDYPYRSGITPTLVKNLRDTGFKIIERFGMIEGDLAIDIGSNDGTLLSGFRDRGMRVLGIEATNIAGIANQNGIPTIQEFFSERLAGKIVAGHGKAKVITAANMFAHVAALGNLICGVEHLLDDGGVFVTESHYLMDILATVQYDSIYHEHLKFYSLKSLIKLFSYYDFTIADIERIENYGGSIRVYAIKGRGHQVSDAVTDLLREEKEFGLHGPGRFEEFKESVLKSKRDLQYLMINAAARDEKVIGVGCPGRASTLINFCGIDTQMMPYIAEQSTSLKLGLYLPGMHIPIVDEEVLFREPPEYVLMLSWHYWRPIVANLRKKGLKSKIILPLPEMRILEDE
jgi:hypothetical protein